jgi:hypothetical protein
MALLGIIFALPSPTFAAAWHLVQPCDPNSQVYNEFKQGLESAAVGTPSYLPYPFPDRREEIIENLIYGLRRSLPEPVPEADRPLFEAVDQGRATFRVTPVTDWTPLHCGRREARPIYHLIQVFDQGHEITRATLSPSGLIGSVLHWAGGPLETNPPALPADPSDLLRKYGQALPANARDFQYVSVWGTLRCDDIVPCVAFRSANRAYLWWWEPTDGRNSLFRIEVAGPRHSQQETFSTPAAKQQLLQSIRASSRELITLGGDVMVEAVAVTATEER